MAHSSSHTQYQDRFSDSTPGFTETTFVADATPREARDSTHLLPVTDRKKHRYIPLALRFPVAFGVPFSMILLAIALEIGIVISNRDKGFSVPTKNAISFASAQFLLVASITFHPSLVLTNPSSHSYPQCKFIIPPAWVYRELDWHVRWHQPYVVMSRGNARAEESVLLDYVTLGPLLSLINSAKFKHRVITWSTITALVTYILQPLAGSMFQLQNNPTSQGVQITSVRTIGLADFSDLTAFVSSAGFAEAAVFNSLPDPPFIFAGWTLSQFDIPSIDYLNGTLQVNTTGIQTNPNCEGPNGTPTVASNAGGFIITSTSVDGCTQSVDASDLSAQQYGVTAVPESCSTLNVTQRPVMFWFFHTTNGTPEARTVFCKPTIQAFNVEATANLNNNSVVGVQTLNSDAPTNNVTGLFADGALNGVIFENQTNPFIQARATATNNGVPGAIFRFAAQSSGGTDGEFAKSNSFLSITTDVYTQFLALAAKSVYFVPQDTPLNAEVVSINTRLLINNLPGHALALLLFFIGFVGIFLHIINRRQRRGLYLSTPPGTIAATVAMTSHSGFGELLWPSDDEKLLETKLSGLRFGIDRQTGAIVASPAPRMADDGQVLVGETRMGMARPPFSAGSSSYEMKFRPFSTESTTVGTGEGMGQGGRDEALESLLGHRHNNQGSLDLAAFEAASASASTSTLVVSPRAEYPPLRLKDPEVAKRVRILHIYPHFVKEAFDTMDAPSSQSLLTKLACDLAALVRDQKRLIFHKQKTRLHFKTCRDLMQAMMEILSHLPNLTEYHVLWSGLTSAGSYPALVISAPFRLNLRCIRLEISLEKVPYMLSHHSQPLPFVQELDLFIRIDHLLEPADYDINLLLLAQMINSLHSSLRKLTIQLWEPFNLSPLFSAITKLPLLDKLSLSIPMSFPNLGDPAGLIAFFNLHSNTLRSLSIRASELGGRSLIPNEYQLGEWMEWTFSKVHLSSLTSLEISLYLVPFDSALLCVRRFSSTLTSLVFTGLHLALEDVEQLADAFCSPPLEEHASLQYARVGPLMLSPQLVDILAQKFSNLIKLELLVKAVVPSETDVPFYCGGVSCGRARSSERDQDEAQFMRFAEEMKHRRYTEWELVHLDLSSNSYPG
ncbi:hypothetical protein D9757_003317 [Collybiopsis confluens]|uniref:Uncharacterized protein n=1 Tax=Collybiopsis confluens TaxID=2823264 RepID=A0A8H5MFR0_9AGAR|nr:hypothetical protein D9757_003317 [Collybiopsis confluens]